MRDAGGLVKRFSHRFEATASYTWSRARDAQSPFRGPGGIANWQDGRTVSGRHDAVATGISLYDLPHRVVLAGTYALPWRRWTTDLSLYYVGESGSPLTYVAWGAKPGLGDLNADGFAGNDPIYIPKSAFDTTEIAFSGRSDAKGADNSPAAKAQRVVDQQTAFDRLIDGNTCLRGQRGRIMERNSCREPWGHTTILSVRQSIPLAGGHALAAQLDVFNVPNLLRRDWGQYRVARPNLLEHVGQTTGSPPQPLFRYDPTKPLWETLPTESSYQLQLSLRYSF